MSFILPILSGVVLFGSTFDLRRYELRPYQIYSNSEISKYSEITNINTFKSEFFVVDTPIELRKALDVDVATGLKAAVGYFPYQHREHLDYAITSENDVRIMLKLSMRTVNESLPFNMPTIGNWKAKGPERVGSHYVKSIVYGADDFIILSIFGNNRQHKNDISETISSTLGKSGILDSSFKEKFEAVVEKHQADYRIYSFGRVSLNNKYIPPSNIDEVLILKDTFQEVVSEGNKRYKVSYEMQSLSFLDPRFPSIDINSEILNFLEVMELKYEDIAVASKEYTLWLTDPTLRFTTENEAQIEKFDLALDNARTAMDEAIINMDVTGNINQFDDALQAYGEENDATKYRSWFNRLKQSIKS